MDIARTSKGDTIMRVFWTLAWVLFATNAIAAPSESDYRDAIELFKHAGESAAFFRNSYGYAVFPNIGKGAFIVGGAYGAGRVYARGAYVGDTSLAQVSVGFQAGGEGYSQIAFFQDKRAFDEFATGSFEFDAGVRVVAITATAGGQAGTAGASGDASAWKNDAVTAGRYYKGMVVFTIVKGGALYQASLAGQKYSYKPRRRR
jgi:lipid-binding SYLF domain-containing protein